MNKNLAALVAVAFAGWSPLTQAAILEVQFSVNITRSFDFATNSYHDITPVIGFGGLQFDPSLSSLTIDGPNTSTSFGNLGDIYPTSPPGAPSGGGAVPDAYVTASTRNSASSFVQSVDFHYMVVPGQDRPQYFGAYDFQLVATQESAPRTDSPANQAFTSDNIASFYQGLAASGAPVHYIEQSVLPTFSEDGFPIGISGQRWEDVSARIVGVKLDGVTLPVPEPTTWALMGLGLAGLALASRQQAASGRLA